MTTTYRVNVGQHIEPIPDIPGDKEENKGRTQTIGQGQTFVSQNDWYATKWPEKFTRMDGGVPVNGPFTSEKDMEEFRQWQEWKRLQQEPNKGQHIYPASSPPKEVTSPPTPPPLTAEEYEAALDRMSIDELRKHAAEESIDVRSARNKQELLRVIKASLEEHV